MAVKISIKKSKVFYIALIAFLIMMAMNFSDDFIRTAEVFKANIEIEKVERQGYKNYDVLEGNFKFSLPSTWNAWEQSFAGGEIIYHLNFMSPNKKIHGFIQAWKLNKPLAQFLKESEKAAVGPVDFKFYNKKEIMVNRNKGFLIQYERPNDKGNLYRAYEGFLEDDKGNIYRASFYTEAKDWRKYYTIIFNRIIQSFKIK